MMKDQKKRPLNLTAAFGALVTATGLMVSNVANAEPAELGWSVRFTPALISGKAHERFGGGADPELNYTLNLGGAYLSAGGRIGAYYAKNLFGLTVMPTLRLMVPVGPVEPYVAFGLGYGWLPKAGHEDFATMSRLGVLFRFSERFAIGLEGTLQKLDGSDFRFPSFGSAISIDL